MTQYYLLFDGVVPRAGIKDYYDSTDSIMVYGGEIFIGVDKITEKLNNLPKVYQRNITASDFQPTNDGGVILNIFGRIQFTDATTSPFFFTEMLIIKLKVTSYYIQNQYLRTPNINATTGAIATGDNFKFAHVL